MVAIQETAPSQLIVLGRGMPGGIPSRQTNENALAAVSYYHEQGGGITTVVFSGGRSHFAKNGGSGGNSEAEAMRDLAVQASLPIEKTQVECASSSTLENFIFSAELLEQDALTGVVAHRHIMPRALFIAQKILGDVRPVYAEDYDALPEEVGVVAALAESIAFLKDRAALAGVSQGDVKKAHARNGVVVKLEGLTDVPLRKVTSMMSSYK